MHAVRGGEKHGYRMPDKNFDRGAFRLFGVGEFVDQKTIGFLADDRPFADADDPRDVIDLGGEGHRRRRGDDLVSRLQPLLTVFLRPTENSNLDIDRPFAVVAQRES
jgi:hypothetical protein